MNTLFAKLNWKWLALGGLVLLVAFGIYNNPDRKGNQITLPSEQQTIVDSLVPKATKLQPINAKVKIDTANLVNLINAAETAGLDNFEFNSSSKTLLESATALQVELDSLLSFLNESRTVMAGGQIQNVWDTIIEVFNFRNEHNQKLIEMARIGTTLDFDNDTALEEFTNVATELETIELRLPEMESKFIAALAELDPGVGRQAERQLEKQKSETSQLLD